jgi:hypothetical protein
MRLLWWVAAVSCGWVMACGHPVSRVVADVAVAARLGWNVGGRVAGQAGGCEAARRGTEVAPGSSIAGTVKKLQAQWGWSRLRAAPTEAPSAPRRSFRASYTLMRVPATGANRCQRGRVLCCDVVLRAGRVGCVCVCQRCSCLASLPRQCCRQGVCAAQFQPEPGSLAAAHGMHKGAMPLAPSMHACDGRPPMMHTTHWGSLSSPYRAKLQGMPLKGNSLHPPSRMPEDRCARRPMHTPKDTPLPAVAPCALQCCLAPIWSHPAVCMAPTSGSHSPLSTPPGLMHPALAALRTCHVSRVHGALWPPKSMPACAPPCMPPCAPLRMLSPCTHPAAQALPLKRAFRSLYDWLTACLTD